MAESIIFTGKKCNNNCTICSVDAGEDKDALEMEDIEQKIKEALKVSDRISLTGGDPTEHPHFLEILKMAKDLGCKGIGVGTNGVNLADRKFVEEMADLGVDNVSIAIHGPPSVHNKITQKNSYDKAIQGLVNSIQKEFKKGVTMDSVVMRSNVSYLGKFWESALRMGVKRVNLMSILPEGRASTNFQKEALSYSEIKKFFYKNKETLKKFEIFFLMGFLRCSFPPKAPSALSHIPDLERSNWDFYGREGTPSKNFEKKDVCHNCPYSKNCAGPRRVITDIFGEEDFYNMLEMDNFIERSIKLESS